MAGFTLKHGSDVFDCDVLGAVTQNGSRIGRWTTNAGNQLVVVKDAGGDVPFDVTWQFNADNQLCLKIGATELVNFHTVKGNRPLLTTRNAVLRVRPDRNNAFEFELRGEWDLTPDHLLSFTINGLQSVLVDGFVEDDRSRFMYHFRNRRQPAQISLLGFVGQWSVIDENGVARASFEYRREDGSVDVFALPAALRIDRTINQFVYEYDRAGRTYRVQLVGFLRISETFQISYAIERQVSQGEEQVAATTFTLNAVFSNKTFTGDLELSLIRPDGGRGTTLAISGQFTSVLGRTQLQVGFMFKQTIGGAAQTLQVGFGGALILSEDGKKVEWSVTVEGRTTTVALAVSQIKLGDAHVDARLNVLAQNGRLAGVRFLLGVAW